MPTGSPWQCRLLAAQGLDVQWLSIAMLSGGSQWWRHPWVVLGIQPSGVGHKKEDGGEESEEKEVDESEEEDHEKQMSGTIIRKTMLRKTVPIPSPMIGCVRA